ncbi:hypothetical protein CBP52_15200 [Cellulomonas sp. PSBB021]|nr:hypothetical protein CBP52_15200 [Cellulomonas sp. PSBB021]
MTCAVEARSAGFRATTTQDTSGVARPGADRAYQDVSVPLVSVWPSSGRQPDALLDGPRTAVWCTCPGPVPRARQPHPTTTATVTADEVTPGAPGAPHAAGPAAPDPRRWRILAVVAVTQFMLVLDASTMNIALPRRDAA